MQCLLIYDIPNDRIRTKVAEVCLDYGLDRLQYSAFGGQLNRGQQDELLLRIKKKMGKRAGNVQVIPICASDWAARLTHIVAPKPGEEEGQRSEDGGRRTEVRSQGSGGEGREEAALQATVRPQVARPRRGNKEEKL
jgi:CRISPR-associated protein Cas2